MQRFPFHFEVCLLLFVLTGCHSAAGQERRGTASKASMLDGRQVSKKESGAPAHRADGISASGRGAFVPLWRYAVKIAPSYGHGGLVCGDWSGDGSPQILVRTKAGMLVLDQNGRKQALVPLGDQSDLLALGRTPQGPLLIGFRVWGNIVEAYDRLGKRLWSYPAGEKAGVGAMDWAAVVDIGDPNEKNSQGSPVLIVAANRGYSDLVRLLLERGANINARRKDGDTALMVAIEEEHSEIACQLIRKGAAIDTTSRSGGMEFPLLSLAVMVGQSDVVEALLKAGAHANAPDSLGNTPLFGAEKVEIARLLLDHGATLDARNWTGDTPLMNAVRDSKLAMVKFLIERGADVNAREDAARTRFQVEQMFGDKKTFDREKRLLQSGKLAVRHEDGKSILEWAEIMASHSSDKSVDNEIIGLLKSAGVH